MFTQQRGDAERIVLLRVLLTAGPKVPEVQQLQCQGEDAVPFDAERGEVIDPPRPGPTGEPLFRRAAQRLFDRLF